MSHHDANDEIAKEIVHQVQRFVTSWSDVQVHDIEINRISVGYLNTVYAVKRLTPDGGQNGPNMILFRKYGGTKLSETLKNRPVRVIGTETEQTLIMHQLGKSGRSPRIYGVFTGGRIEEYISGHTLTPDDLSDPLVLTGFAEAFAAYHSLKMPFTLSNDYSINRMKERLSDRREEYRSKLTASYPGINTDFMDFDLEDGRDWYFRNVDAIQSPTVFSHVDNNYLNFMIRDSEVEGRNKYLIIDYEMSRYGQRFFDLGCFFVNKTLVWNGKDSKNSGHPYPDEEQRRIFLEHYSRMVQNGNDGQSKIDSLQHLTLEADFGAVFTCLRYCDNIIKMAAELASVEQAFVTSLVPHLQQLYTQLRSDFDRKYPDFR